MLQEKLTYYPQFDTPKNPYIKDNLKSLLGERFNVLENTVRYSSIAGKFYKKGGKEPFIETIKRGRDVMRSYPDPVDYKREDAEVIGFGNVQDILADPFTSIGTMMISISPYGPEGSAYQKNHYDIYTKKDWGVEMRRYSSDLTYQEYAKLYLDLGFEANGETADDAFFLANPIKVPKDKFRNADELHKYLFREHQYITVQHLEKIWRENSAAASVYLRAVAEGNPEFKDKAINAFLNSADMSHFDREEEVYRESDSKGKFFALADMLVREVKTGCGTSGGLGQPRESSSSGSRSVAEFGEQVGVMECVKCPFCGETVDAILTKTKIICPNEKCKKVADRGSSKGLN